MRGVVNGALYPFPINRNTLNRLYGLDLDEADAAAFFERAREPRDPVRTSEDVVLNSVERDLYEKFSSITRASSGTGTFRAEGRRGGAHSDAHEHG